MQNKSLAFAIRCVNLYKFLTSDERVNREFILSKQMLRSGTSIGANIAESRNAQSDADFTSKLSIALKEADETSYWFELLKTTRYIPEKEYESINNDLDEIIAMLVAAVKKSKTKTK